MELRQLAYLLAVVEEGGFTRAADRLHVAQPGVSAQIRRLERELGQELLDRSGRSVRPTEVGAAVLPYARAALAAVDDVRLAVDELTGLVRGRVTIGTVTSHGADLATLLAGFHRDHPAVEITLTEDDSERLVEALRDGRLDAAIIAFGGTPPEGLGLRVLTEEPIVAAVGHDDELARGTEIALDDLRDRVLISLPRGAGVRAILDDACAAAGFSPRIAFEAGSPEMLAELAARGLGVAIVPASTVAERRDLSALTIHPPDRPGLSDGPGPSERPALSERPGLRGSLAFAWRGEGPMSPAARTLVARARRLLGT